MIGTIIPMRERAARYMDRMPFSIQGQGGSTALLKAAIVPVKGFGLSEEQALELLAQWNETHCQPKWSLAELRHKVKDAAQANVKDGYLLEENRETASSRAAVSPPRVLQAQQPARPWPSIQPLQHGEVQEIATRRKIPVEGIEVLFRAGMIGRATYEGHECYIIGERGFAQARRFDGGTLPTQGGPRKTKNLPGARGAFIGRRWALDSHCPVLLVEGALGLAEAIGAHHLADPVTGWACIAATSASSRFARDAELLHTLKGRRIRIVPDADEEGRKAAAIWAAELEQVNATVDAVALPEGCKDLGDVLAEAEKHQPFITSLFV